MTAHTPWRCSQKPWVSLWASTMGEADRRIVDSCRIEKYNDMREIYVTFCHTDGEPMYLSDGIYLKPNGGLIECK